MRVPRVRLTVRRMMVAVAVLALVLGGWLWGLRRRERFVRLAKEHVSKADSHLSVISSLESGHSTTRGFTKSLADRAIRERESLRYHLGLWLKYQRAARFPWLPVSPDPPPPD